MNILCDEPCVACPPLPLGAEGIFPNPNSEANPFSNFSSEAPDRVIFIGRNYTPRLGDPPLGQPWTATGCIGLCFSTVSQEDADLCAARQGVICTPCCTNPPFPPGLPADFCINNPDSPLCAGGPAPIFASNSQQCAVQCPDGTYFNFTTVAGLFLELNQQLANDKAYSWACQKAAQNKICFGSLSRTAGCTGESFSSFIAVTSLDNRPVTFQIIAGVLPPGLLPSQSNPYTQFYTGTPTVSGTFAFTLRATDTIGNVLTKNLAITIIGITTASPLPNATLNTAYSTTLHSDGPVGTPTWTVAVGSLPPGLTLNSASGQISGTPTIAGVYNFTVRLDATGI